MRAKDSRLELEIKWEIFENIHVRVFRAKENE